MYCSLLLWLFPDWRRSTLSLSYQSVYINVPLTLYSLYFLEKNEIRWGCGTHEREREKLCIQGFTGGRLGERVNLEELSVDGKIILKWFLRKAVRRAWGGFIWLDMRDKWWVLVKAVMKLLVPEEVGNFLTTWRARLFNKEPASGFS